MRRGARLEGSQVLPAENSPGTGGLSWHPACFAGSCPAPLLRRRAASTSPFSYTQLVYIKKLSPGFRTVWVRPEKQGSVTASVVQSPRRFIFLAACFAWLPCCVAWVTPILGMYYLPDPCKVEKFCYSSYYAWGIKAVLCFYWLWNLDLNSRSQMAWAMSVRPGGAGAQVRASPSLCLRFLFLERHLDFPDENQSDSQHAGSPQGTSTLALTNKAA